MNRQLLTEEETAYVLRVTPASLRYMSAAGCGPAMVKAPGGWRYPIGGIDEYIEQNQYKGGWLRSFVSPFMAGHSADPHAGVGEPVFEVLVRRVARHESACGNNAFNSVLSASEAISEPLALSSATKFFIWELPEKLKTDPRNLAEKSRGQNLVYGAPVCAPPPPRGG